MNQDLLSIVLKYVHVDDIDNMLYVSTNMRNVVKSNINVTINIDYATNDIKEYEKIARKYKCVKTNCDLLLPNLDNILHLTYGHAYCGKVINLPNKLLKLTFGHSFNKRLYGVQFPDTIEHLTFGKSYNWTLDGVKLPKNLKYLTFGDNYESCIDDVCLPNITHLKFGKKYNHGIADLPESVTHLTLGECFNKGVHLDDNHKLKYLKFGDGFNNRFSDIPTHLEYLEFGFGFIGHKGVMNLPVPKSVKHLKTNNDCSNLDKEYVESLKSLTIYLNHFYSKKKIIIPKSTTELFCSSGNDIDINTIPDKLQKMSIMQDDSMSRMLPPTETIIKKVSHFKHLTHLYLDNYFNTYIEEYPCSLKHIEYGYKYNNSIDNLPNSVETIVLGDNFDSNIHKYPKNLRRLHFGCYFSRPVENLPHNLRILHFGRHFNRSIDRLPESVTELVLGRYFDRDINKFPVCLKSIDIHCDIDCIKICKFPDSLKKITIDYTESVYNIHDIYKLKQMLPEMFKLLEIRVDNKTKYIEIPSVTKYSLTRIINNANDEDDEDDDDDDDN